MSASNNSYLDRFIETMGREALTEIQIKKFQMMLERVLESNVFYKNKFERAGITHPEDIKTLDDLHKLPFTTKQELSTNQEAAPPYGTNLTFTREQYTRIHQTSGTTGQPLRWLDTEESWKWWARCWASVYKAAGVRPHDRVFFAFSFGPFIGFWSAYEGAHHIKALSIPGGGMSSYQRVNAILTHDVTVLVCTPTYALHLAEVAEEQNIDIKNSNVRITIQAGEPGASLPGTKARIEEAWGAKCYDHAGATEVGAWGYECQSQNGLHVNEGEFICEVIDPESGEHANEGELVITNLGRIGMPIIRYRTGDRVKIMQEPCGCGRTYRRLEGGVIGRIDQVYTVRGINVFPSAIENIVRRFPESGEFAVDIYRRKILDEMEVRIEVKDTDPEVFANLVSDEIRNGLGIRVKVIPVPFGTLPRFDLKARRFTDHREID
ncbi:MAG: phenylacetate--CoA ligase family protein [Gammaproteobacteria bacterium]|nr:phenylacetate--CoA ligase family protein [Gammaproteobacteria bacterium]